MSPSLDFSRPGGIILGIPPPPPHPVPVPRGPLPPFDRASTDPQTGAPLPVYTTINGTIPPAWTKGYMRSNLWGLTLPYLPPIDGGATGPAQNRLLTYLADRYPQPYLDQGLALYGQRGYEQWWLSIPDSRGLGIQGYCDLTKRVLDAGLIPAHFLRSKDYDNYNPDPYWIYPYVDALANIKGAFTIAAHAWEASLFYKPQAFMDTIALDASRYPDVQWCVHLQQAYADFGPDGPNHGPIFWQHNLQYGVKTLLYQYDPSWSAGMMAARGNDVSVRFIQGGLWGLPETVNWVVFEQLGMPLFYNGYDGDGRQVNEDIADLKGYECLCTPGPLPPAGFGNGARYPNGGVI